MGEVTRPEPVLSLVAVFSRYDDAFRWAKARAVAEWGPIALESPLFDFVETDYYEPTMGPGIKKCFWAFEQLIDPAALVERKLASNQWEIDYAAAAGHAEPRPLNIDPGYLTAAKLILASTKDFVHRIYLDRGIYAETTLFYRHRRWQDHQWTFPDYRRADYQQFFTECRDYFRGGEKSA